MQPLVFFHRKLILSFVHAYVGCKGKQWESKRVGEREGISCTEKEHLNKELQFLMILN